jgi:hypothetical protein
MVFKLAGNIYIIPLVLWKLLEKYLFIDFLIKNENELER